MNHGSRMGATLLVAVCLAASPAHAIQIVGDFFGGDAPTLTAGGGDVAQIFDAAAGVWERALPEDHRLDIQFGWVDFPGSTLGNSLALTVAGGRTTTALITLDNGSPWFLDPTPHGASEWSAYEELRFDLGTGELAVGRDYTGPMGDAAFGWDLFTVLVHEIGHSLGLGVELARYRDETLDGDIDITAPLPHAGLELFVTTAGGAHLLLSSALMFPSVELEARTLPSDADILAVAQAGNFGEVSFAVPEPPRGLLAGLAFWAWLHRRRRAS